MLGRRYTVAQHHIKCTKHLAWETYVAEADENTEWAPVSILTRSWLTTCDKSESPENQDSLWGVYVFRPDSRHTFQLLATLVSSRNILTRILVVWLWFTQLAHSAGVELEYLFWVFIYIFRHQIFSWTFTKFEIFLNICFCPWSTALLILISWIENHKWAPEKNYVQPIRKIFYYVACPHVCERFP